MSNFLNQLLKERAFEKRGVFNRIQSSTVCNASAEYSDGFTLQFRRLETDVPM